MSLGGKAEGLALLRARYPELVPDFTAIPVSELVVDWPGFKAQAEAALAEHLSGADGDYASRAAELGSQLRLDEQALSARLREAGVERWGLVSVRSSALSEDGAEASFAGQFETALDVSFREIPDAVARSIRSMIAPGVAAYARRQKMDRLELGGSVIVQRMVHGSLTGVLFSENGRGETLVAFAEGARNTTVEGENATELRLPRLEPIPARLPVPARLIEVGLELERQLGTPVDVEWAARGRRLWLLQVRPQTVRRLTYELGWDCTNIAENYPGVTLPLSYSFIRELYARVYPEFFRLLGVSRRRLAEHATVFRNTLGYLRGRVHYQIDNWYEMVKLIPGSRHNTAFFTAMLQPAKEGQTVSRPKPGPLGSLILAGLALRLGVQLLRSERLSRRFTRDFAQRYDRAEALDWDALQADAILSTLDRLRTELLGLWAVPILNDLRVMVFHGLLKTWAFGPERHAEYLDYLRGLSDRASIAPLTALAALGDELQRTHGPDATPATVLASPQWSTSRPLVEAYLAEFGGRAPDELQLENPRLGDDHAGLIALALGASGTATLADPAARVHGTKLGTAWLGRHTRRAIDWRERFRFNRAQVFGIARRAYLALGRRLVEAGLLEAAEDVFWLTEGELDGIVFAHAWDREVRSVVTRRRAELPALEAEEHGRRTVGSGLIAPEQLRNDDPRGDGSLGGMGVSAGVLTAEVIVAEQFDSSLDVRGRILVASHIDPGWTLLFVQAAGVITERGNALSHVAIISRELGIPAVVAAMGARSRLRDGMMVTIDGTTGAITLEQ